MKTLTKLLTLGIIAIGMVACGKQNTTDPNALTTPVNGGYYNQNGQWVPNTTYSGQGGCVPLQSGSFSFTGTGVYQTQSVIMAGLFPQNSTAPGAHGTVTMGGSVNATQGMIQYQPKQSSNGMIQLSASMQGGTISGVVQFQPYLAQQIAMMYGGGAYNQYPYNQQTNTSLCVQSMALDIVQNVMSSGYGYPGYPSQGYGQIIQALVYLTLSNGQVAGPFAF